MTQLTLDQAARNPDRLAGIRRRSTRRANRLTIRERFEYFHAKNPGIYELLVKLAREAKAEGFEKYSVKTLYEVARWHYRKKSKKERGFVMNNDFTSYYSRLIEENEPELRGFFEKRKQRSQ